MPLNFLSTKQGSDQSKGFVAMITPIAWETGENYELFRGIYLTGNQSTLLSIINLPFDVFPEAYVDTNIAVFRAMQFGGSFYAREFGKYEKIPDVNNLLYGADNIPLTFITEEPGKKIYFSKKYYEMLARFRNKQFVGLGDLTDACQGIVESFYEYSPLKMNEDYLLYFVCTADRYQITFEEQSYINFKVTNPLYKFYTQTRILFRRLVSRQDRLMATIVKEPFVVRKDLNPFILIHDSGYDLNYMLACLNSKLHSYLYINTSALAQKDDFRQTTLTELRRLPIASISFNTEESDRKKIGTTFQSLFLEYKYGDVLETVESELNHNRSDTIHDLLAYLAEQMIAMHKDKQALTADFWTDLEGATDDPAAFRKLRDKGKQEAGLAADPALVPFVRPDSKSARTLDESLAWDEAAFKGFVRALAGPVDGLSRLLKVYHTHAPRYRDLTERIGRTDRLIDQIVYKLYGLTDEEIAIVEGKG